MLNHLPRSTKLLKSGNQGMIPKHPLCQDTELWVVHGSFPSNRKSKSWASTLQGQGNGLTHLGKPTGCCGRSTFLNSSSEAWTSHISFLGLYFLICEMGIYHLCSHAYWGITGDNVCTEYRLSLPPHTHTHWVLTTLDSGEVFPRSPRDWTYTCPEARSKEHPHYDSLEAGRETSVGSRRGGESRGGRQAQSFPRS